MIVFLLILIVIALLPMIGRGVASIGRLIAYLVVFGVLLNAAHKFFGG